MDMKYVFFPVVLIIILLSTYTTTFAASPDSTNGSLGIMASYWGTIKNTPGLRLGIEKTYFQSTKYSVIGSATLQMNRKPDIYTSAGFNFGNTLRRTWKRGFYLEHGINIGYLGRYYDFDIYRTNSDGNIINVGRKWNSTMILGYSIGMGYDFTQKTNTNVKLFLKPGIFYDLLNRTNYYYVNNYSIEIGVVLHPQWLIRNK